MFAATKRQDGLFDIAITNDAGREARKAFRTDTLEVRRGIDYSPTEIPKKVVVYCKKNSAEEMENLRISEFMGNTPPNAIVRAWYVGGKKLSGVTVRTEGGQLVWFGYDSNTSRFTRAERITCSADHIIRKCANGKRGDAVHCRRLSK